MSLDWCLGTRAACRFWRPAPMLQHVFEALQASLESESDALIDAAKGLVESVWRVVIDPLELHRLHDQPDWDSCVETARGATVPAAAPVEE